MIDRPILAIETSCDETAAAVLSPTRAVLANIVHTQVAEHAPYGGVVPEIASREHLSKIQSVVDRALDEAGLTPAELGAVAATYGPGLIGALLVGLSYAKGMAQALGLPFVGVHHIEGHLMAASVDENAPGPPFIGLVASGGHSTLFQFGGQGRAEILGETRDDAAGEAFDKSAKLLGLGYPGGAIIDRLADEGEEGRFKLPIALRNHDTYDYSFSGLKTAVRLEVAKLRESGDIDDKTLRDLCADLRRVIVDALLDKAILACRRKQVLRLVLGGGVAANGLLRREAERRGAENDIEVYVPPRKLCTDNAVMIGACALAQLEAGKVDELTLRADPGAPIIRP